MLSSQGNAGDPPPRPADDQERRSDGLYRYLFDNNPQPMWVYDAQSLAFLEVNRAALQKYGYSRDEFMRLTIKDIRPPEDVPDLLPSLAHADDDGRDRRCLARHRTRGGEDLWVEILSHGVLYEGRPARVVLSHDVTARVVVEAALRESEQRYRTLFDQSPLAVLHFDRDLRVIACNGPLARALGFESPDDLVGFDLNRLHDKRVLPAFEQARSGTMAAYEGPYRATRRELNAWIALHVSPIQGDDGEVQGGLAVIEDITVRKADEARLEHQAHELERVNDALRRRTDELERVLQSKNKLYAVLNHELRTPISAIMLYNDLLLDGVVGPLSEQQAESIRLSQRAAQHLLELVQDVIDLARLNAGKTDIVVESVRLEDLLAHVVATFQPLATRRGCRTDLVVDPSGTELVSDSRRLRQIVFNLLSNAVKFGDGKPVTLRCDPTEDGGAVISVTDQGPGILPADMERIFEEFYQVGGGAQDGGSGLGLAISRRLAEVLGAALTVESEPGRGSTFFLRLPPHPPRSDGTTQPDPAPSSE